VPLVGVRYVGTAVPPLPSSVRAGARRSAGGRIDHLRAGTPLIYGSFLNPRRPAASFSIASHAGLVLRSIGESHDAAHAIGYRVIWVRYLAILFGGAMSGTRRRSTCRSPIADAVGGHDGRTRLDWPSPRRLRHLAAGAALALAPTYSGQSPFSSSTTKPGDAISLTVS